MKHALRLAAGLAAPILMLGAGAIDAPAKKPAAAPPPAAAPAAPTAADWRTPDPNDVLVIDTNKGRVIVEMVPEVAPKNAEQIRALAREKFYDGLRFFRVIDKFMAQTGDPQNNG